MTFCLEGCFKLTRQVFSPPLFLIQELHKFRTCFLKGVLRQQSIGLKIEVQPPGINITSELHSLIIICPLSFDWCGQYLSKMSKRRSGFFPYVVLSHV